MSPFAVSCYIGRSPWGSPDLGAPSFVSSFLMELGHTLAAVEEIITGQLTFDEVAID